MPRIDREILAAHSEGLVCLSGCLSSEFSRCLLGLLVSKTSHSMKDERLQVGFRRFLKTVISLKFKTMAWICSVITAAAIDLSNEMGIPPVATCDCHYVNREDAEAQDILLCVNTGRFRNDVAHENGYDRVLSEKSG